MEKLYILWTTDNKDTISKMLAMYAINAKTHGWWSHVTVIIWGASAKLAGADVEVQSQIKEMLANGLVVEACKACSDSFGVSDTLASLGVNVRYMGQPLTEYLKSGDRLLTL